MVQVPLLPYCASELVTLKVTISPLSRKILVSLGPLGPNSCQRWGTPGFSRVGESRQPGICLDQRLDHPGPNSCQEECAETTKDPRCFRCVSWTSWTKQLSEMGNPRFF